MSYPQLTATLFNIKTISLPANIWTICFDILRCIICLIKFEVDCIVTTTFTFSSCISNSDFIHETVAKHAKWLYISNKKGTDHWFYGHSQSHYSVLRVWETKIMVSLPKYPAEWPGHYNVDGVTWDFHVFRKVHLVKKDFLASLNSLLLSLRGLNLGHMHVLTNLSSVISSARQWNTSRFRDDIKSSGKFAIFWLIKDRGGGGPKLLQLKIEWEGVRGPIFNY